MKRTVASVGVAVLLCAMLSPTSNADKRSKYFDPETMIAVDELEPGMTGTCRTVLRGTVPESFDVEILQVLREGKSEIPYVLFRITSGPLIARNSCVPRGMSGSPVYVNGRLAGAASRAVGITKEPIAAFTPIEYMLECLDEMDRVGDPLKKKPGAVRTIDLASPIVVEGTERDVAVLCDRVEDMPAELMERGLPLVPCSMPMVVHGISPRTRSALEAVLKPRGLYVMQGVTGSSRASAYEIEPGSAIGLSLMSGDFTAAAGGTVTYVRDGRFLAFGHPMFGNGPVHAPATYMDVAGFVVQETDLAEKLMLPIDADPFGTFLQDREAACGGTTGTEPVTFPMEIHVAAPDREAEVSYSVRIARDERMGPIMCIVATMSALEKWCTSAGDYVVQGRVEATGIRGTRVAVTAFEHTRAGPTPTIPSAVAELTALLMTNIFSPEDVGSLRVDLAVTERRAEARLLRLELEDWVVEAGQSAQVRVVYQLVDGEGLAEQTIEIPIPADHPGGGGQLVVAGGAGVLAAESQLGYTRPQPTDLPSLVSLVESTYTPGNRLVAMVSRPGQAFLSGGVTYPSVPGEISELLSAAGTTDYAQSSQVSRFECDTDYDIVGMLTHPLVVVRPEDRALGSQPRERDRTGSGGREAATGAGSAGATWAATDLRTSWLRYTNPPPDLVEALTTLCGAGLSSDTSWLLWQGPPPPGIHMPPDAEPGSVKPARPEPKPRPTQSDGKEEGAGSDEGEEAAEAGAKVEAIPVREPSVWTQTSFDDFAAGTLEGTTVLDTGAVALAAPTQTVLSYCPPALYAWCAVPDGKGGAYLGTGPKGVVYHVSADGACTEFLNTGDAQVFSMVRLSDGSLVVGTGPRGLLMRVSAVGKELGRVETGEAYVWGIVEADNSVLAATGPNGRILRVTADGKITVFEDVRQDHVLSIARGADGDFYFGTDTGNLYSLSPDGFARPLGQSPLGAVYAVCLGPDGCVYFASGGNAYRLTAEREIVEALATPDTLSFALAANSRGLFMGTSAQARVYAIDGTGLTSLYARLERPDGRIIALAPDEDGGVLWVLTLDPVMLYRLPMPSTSEGVFCSSVLDGSRQCEWLSLSVSGALPEGTWVKVLTRGGNTALPDDDWAPWTEAYHDGTMYRVAPSRSRYFQYQLVLHSDAPPSLPTVSDVQVRYLPSNRKPKVRCDDISSIRFVNATASVKWDGEDPDNDSLRYTVYSSPDGGLTWNEVKKDITDESYDWDVSGIGDGMYLLRIVASDEVANPGRGLQDAVIVGPVCVDTSAPKVMLAQSGVTIENGTVRVECSAMDKGSTLKVAQWRVDGQDPWQPVVPVDLVYDEDYEILTFTIAGLTPGEHKLEVAAFDRAGNSSTASLNIVVPGEEAEEAAAAPEETPAAEPEEEPGEEPELNEI